MIYIHEFLFIVNSNFLFNNFLFSDFFFITFILYPIFNILTLLIYQALLAGLLEIIGNVDSYNIVLNSTQLFSISAGMRECPSNIVIKNIKGMPLLRPRLLKL